MGILGRLVRGGGDRLETVHFSVLVFDQQRQDADLPIVSESYRLNALARFVRTRGPRGVTHGNLTAVLQPGPSNPKDKNAIRVLLADADGNAAHVASGSLVCASPARMPGREDDGAERPLTHRVPA